MTLKEFLKSVADAIRGREGSAAAIPAAQFASRISAIQTGVELPALTDPAAEEDVLINKGFIGEDGEERYGTLQPYAFTPGWEVMVPLEKTYDSSDVFLQMTSLSGFGNAAVEDVAEGKTFTNEQGIAKVGTAQMGGGMETVEVTMCDYMDRGLYVYYTDGNGRIQTKALPAYDIVIEAAKHTIICVDGYSDDIYPVEYDGEYNPIGDTYNVRKLAFTFGTNGYIRLANA